MDPNNSLSFPPAELSPGRLRTYPVPHREEVAEPEPGPRADSGLAPVSQMAAGPSEAQADSVLGAGWAVTFCTHRMGKIGLLSRHTRRAAQPWASARLCTPDTVVVTLHYHDGSLASLRIYKDWERVEKVVFILETRGKESI